jgi:hypothetical protein
MRKTHSKANSATETLSEKSGKKQANLIWKEKEKQIDRQRKIYLQKTTVILM